MNSNTADSPLPEKRVQLPEPDMDNITVLTRELPNEPILPWHRYDSPWLESEEGSEASSEEAGSEVGAVGALDAEEPENVESDAAETVDEGEAAIPADDLPAPNSNEDAPPVLEDGESPVDTLPVSLNQNRTSPEPVLAQESSGAEGNDTHSIPDAPTVDPATDSGEAPADETPPPTPVLPYLIPMTHAEPRAEDLAPSPEPEH